MAGKLLLLMCWSEVFIVFQWVTYKVLMRGKAVYPVEIRRKKVFSVAVEALTRLVGLDYDAEPLSPK